uniref:F-box domain-containing protein n=1 Tax=Oryza barthii TaxID=65489 RepID=A0A0D3HMQ2_9ORYZ
MAGGVDRISALPDDLIQRILRFAPAREASSTSLLSSRWRSLWRSTGAVNLAVRLPEPDRRHGYRVIHAAVSSCHDAFVRSAQAALAAAAGRHVTRLTLDLRAATMDVIDGFVHTARPFDAGAAPYVEVWERISDDAEAEREVERWVKRGDVVRDVNSLRRFAIQFRMDQPNCIGVKLIKFFAENAIHLEEMRIDGGNQRMHDHINHMVERWISDSSSAKKRANHEISSEGSCDHVPVDSKQGIEASTPRFRLLPLERR